MDVYRDLARIRHDNAMRLFDEFVQATVRHADAAALRGLERRFAERLQIQPSYWSQIKARSRQIGERLARQFEQLCRKPPGWMDQPHAAGADAGTGPATEAGAPAAAGGFGVGAPPAGLPARAAGGPGPAGAGTAPGSVGAGAVPDALQPADSDERFIVGLVLTYYRRHPQRARARLLDLLGEVLTPLPDSPVAPAAAIATAPAAATARGRAPQPPAPRPAPAATPATPAKAPADADAALWQRVQTGVAPLKRKR